MSKESSISYLKMLITDVIRPMSDIGYQKEVWMKKEGVTCDSFGEIVNDFFDFYEAIERIDTKYQQYGLSKHQYFLLKELYEKFDEYSCQAPETDLEVIKDPKWIEIQRFAQRVYKNLKDIV
jgi:hypothetical protein